VLIWAARNLVPSYLGALFIAGIICAALSSASTFLSLVGFSASNDLKASAHRNNLRRTRLAMALISLIILVLSLLLPHNIFWITIFIGTVFASSWGPVGLMSIWSTSITARGARWGMLAGLLGNIIPAGLDYAGIIDLPSYLEPVLLGLTASLIGIGLGSRDKKISEEERHYFNQLHQTPADDVSTAAMRMTLLAPLLLIVYGCTMPWLLLHFYVAPYQIGAGVIAAGDSINWQYAEPWFALGPCLIHVPLGLLTWRVIRKRYSPLSLANVNKTLTPQP
jgi:Na+/pantothenate symporter